MLELQDTDDAGVAEQAKEWNLMTSPHFERTHYIDQLYLARLWWELPLEELDGELCEWGVSVADMGINAEISDEDKRRIYLDWLLWSMAW
eukprot:5527399-Amphidinium_carterae.1